MSLKRWNRMAETIKVKGMHCVSCENKVKEAILSVKGVKTAKVDYTSEKATIDFDPAKTTIKDIMNTIKNVGYQPEEIKESKGFFKKIFG
jgi:Cu+-exporting ATPase